MTGYNYSDFVRDLNRMRFIGKISKILINY
jgi:hypothetical protein